MMSTTKVETMEMDEVIAAPVPRAERPYGLIPADKLKHYEHQPLEPAIKLRLYEVHAAKGPHVHVAALGKWWRLSQHFDNEGQLINSVVAESTPDSAGDYNMEAYCVISTSDGQAFAERHHVVANVSNGKVTVYEDRLGEEDIHPLEAADDDLIRHVVNVAYAEIVGEQSSQLPADA